MSSSYVVFYKIATTCLLIFVGYIARRMKILPEISVSVISKTLMYLAMPAYFLYHMPSSISMDTLHQYWFYPVVGYFLIAANDLFGYVTARIWARPGESATFRILIGLPNWVFMALAVCEPLFGEDGIRVVLLYNMGITFYVWTFGMTGFRSAVGAKEVLYSLFINVQTLALLLGFVLALFVPSVKGMEKLDSATLAALPFHIGILTPLWETVYLVSSVALPLSIMQIGLLLGTPKPAGSGSDTRSVALTSVLRLIAAPVLTLGLQVLLHHLGIQFSMPEFVTSVIVMAMPAAVLCLTVVEVYGGATRLAAKAILWMTLASLLTAPLVTWLSEKVYEWL